MFGAGQTTPTTLCRTVVGGYRAIRSSVKENVQKNTRDEEYSIQNEIAAVNFAFLRET